MWTLRRGGGTSLGVGFFFYIYTPALATYIYVYSANPPPEPTGLERIKEALEANDWAAADDDALLPDDQEDDEAESGFGAEAAELEREMVGLKMAIYGGGGEERRRMVAAVVVVRGIGSFRSSSWRL
jgi:hypothetical protein